LFVRMENQSRASVRFGAHVASGSKCRNFCSTISGALGARNLRRLGIAESVCMKTTGHKTLSIFKRYDITDESDLIEVAARLDQKRQLAENKSHEPDFEQSSNRKQLICHFYDYYQHHSGEQYSARCPA